MGGRSPLEISHGTLHLMLMSRPSHGSHTTRTRCPMGSSMRGCPCHDLIQPARDVPWDRPREVVHAMEYPMGHIIPCPWGAVHPVGGPMG